MTDKLQAQVNTTRITVLLLWTILPCLAMWIGLYVLGSAIWAYFLYHGFCLIPAVIVGRPLWKDSLRWPTTKAWIVILIASLLFCSFAVLSYELVGNKVLSDEQAVFLMKRQGWFGNLFWPISIYAVVVNPVLEELFWRGVVLNALDALKLPVKHFGIIWSSIAYALFHYWIFRLIMFPVYAEIGTICLVFYGVFLAVVYRKSGSIVTTAIVHGLLTDMAALVLMLDLFRRHPDLM
jgi:membrane protease YdiL (CAAX protease family)